MKAYKTIAIVDLFAGLVGLSDDQASKRNLNLKKKRNGVYEITSPVQFKVGEVIKLKTKEKIVLSKLEEVEEK